jgi:hypothetical protein
VRRSGALAGQRGKMLADQRGGVRAGQRGRTLADQRGRGQRRGRERCAVGRGGEVASGARACTPQVLTGCVQRRKVVNALPRRKKIYF